MGKRKSEEEVIRSKIKKLKTELQRRTRCRSRIIYSSDSSEADDDFIVNSEAQEEQRSSSHDHVESPRLAASPPLTPVPDALQEASPQPSTHQKPLRPASALPGPSSAPDLPKTSPQVPPSSPDDEELDDDVLLMLGDAPQPETALGDNIHKDVASRWRDILLKGLQKEVKEKLFQEYPVPSNCDLLVAPTLNPEAKAALIENLPQKNNLNFKPPASKTQSKPDAGQYRPPPPPPQSPIQHPAPRQSAAAPRLPRPQEVAGHENGLKVIRFLLFLRLLEVIVLPFIPKQCQSNLIMKKLSVSF
ncbi:hypothetical protein MSG28_011624 [Choristoneura fumiferana]|uniref:Uncharacterized protein n=1 Tax=Choristoneura fumiferana TaxID=7141 RepID=A0ACC0JPM1_CHOFU|nr:hypothetical protein MSG28_011624 [Choristoneura fumiferana]